MLTEDIQNFKQFVSARWQDHIPDTEILSRANLPSIESMLLIAREGGGCGMAHHACVIPKVLLFGEPANGTHKAGRPKLHFKDSFKARTSKLSPGKPLLPTDPHGACFSIKEPRQQKKVASNPPPEKEQHAMPVLLRIPQRARDVQLVEDSSEKRLDS